MRPFGPRFSERLFFGSVIALLILATKFVIEADDLGLLVAVLVAFAGGWWVRGMVEKER